VNMILIIIVEKSHACDWFCTFLDTERRAEPTLQK